MGAPNYSGFTGHRYLKFTDGALPAHAVCLFLVLAFADVLLLYLPIKSMVSCFLRIKMKCTYVTI